MTRAGRFFVIYLDLTETLLNTGHAFKDLASTFHSLRPAQLKRGHFADKENEVYVNEITGWGCIYLIECLSNLLEAQPWVPSAA
jgi:hypothetical protein